MNDILNPYIAGAPVVETSMFFGREDAFSWIERSLAGKYVDHILVLHGQRRVGKTSVLKQIPNFLPDKYIQVFFDLQGRTNTTLDRFLWWLAREITRTLKQELNISIPRPNRVDFSADPDYLINEFLPSVSSLLDGQILLLTFDEFDTLTDPSIQESLSKPLIAYLRRLMEIKTLNFIFSIGSSGNKLEHMQAAYTDFFKTALYRKISFLTKDDCARLITQPVADVLSYDAQAVDRIFEVTSGHPYFVQLVCHELFSMCQKTGMRNIHTEDVENILSDVIERGTVNLKFVWDEASILQKWVLTGLAQLERETTIEQLSRLLREQQVRFTEADLNSAIIYLRDKDVITEKNQFVIHLMWMWMQKNRPFDRVREELTEVNPIVSRNLELGQEYQANSRFNEAVECFITALGEDPDNLDAQLGLGECYLSAGNVDQSVKVFSGLLENFGESIRVQAGYCNAYFALGDIEATLEHWEAARAAFTRILEINPLHRNATQELVRIFRIQIVQALLAEDIQQAQEILDRALKTAHNPDELNDYSTAIQKISLPNDVRFEILEHLSEQEHARDHWDEGYLIDSYLTQQHPETPMDSDRVQSSREKAHATRVDKLNHWAKTFTKAGESEKALAFWRRLLDFDLPDSDRIRQTIRQLEADHAVAPASPARGSVRWRPWVLPAILSAVLLIVGLIFGPQIWSAISTTNSGSPVVGTEAPVTVKPSSALEDVPMVSAVQMALDTIQSKEPTYQTNFDIWDFGDPMENARVEGGKLILTSENWEYAGVELSNLVTDRFAVEFEFAFDDADPRNGYCAFDFTGDSRIAIVAGFTSSGEAQLSHCDAGDCIGLAFIEYDGKNSNQVTIIVIGEQIATFIDGQLAYSALIPDKSMVFASQNLGQGEKITCEYESYKIWDLGEVDFSAAGIPPTLSPETRAALNILQNEQPLYEITFDAWDFKEPEDNQRMVQGGSLFLASEWQNANLMLPSHPSDMFAVEFELRILESGPEGACYFGVVNSDEGGESMRAIGARFCADGQALLDHYVHPDQYPVIATGEYDETETNTVTLIILGDQITALANGRIAYNVIDPDGGAVYAIQSFMAEKNIVCDFDNYKFWDLSGLDVSTTAPVSETKPTATFYEPILDYTESTLPTFEDDFSTKKSEWGTFDDGTPISDAVSDGVLHLSGTDATNYSLPNKNELFDASDFVLEFECKTFMPDPSLYNGFVGIHARVTERRSAYAFYAYPNNDSWQVKINDPQNSRNWENIDEGYANKVVSKFRLIAKGNEFAFFINDELVSQIADSDITGTWNMINLLLENETSIEIDNVKFWNLDGVEIEQ